MNMHLAATCVFFGCFTPTNTSNYAARYTQINVSGSLKQFCFLKSSRFKTSWFKATHFIFPGSHNQKLITQYLKLNCCVCDPGDVF